HTLTHTNTQTLTHTQDRKSTRLHSSHTSHTHAHIYSQTHTPTRRPTHTHTHFFFNDTATTEIYTLSLHDALPISHTLTHTNTQTLTHTHTVASPDIFFCLWCLLFSQVRSEEHTSELQSPLNL